MNSFELYRQILNFSQRNPAKVNELKNFYVQLLTTVFYELLTQKTSPLLSALCQANRINFEPKNFQLYKTQWTFEVPTGADLYFVVIGLNYAVSEDLKSCQKVYEDCAKNIFRFRALTQKHFQILLSYLPELDKGLGKFFAVKVVEKPVEKIVEKIIEVPAPKQIPAEPDEQDKVFLQSLNSLAADRYSADEKIINEIKNVQLSLQEELPRLQDSLKKISEIRDGLDFVTQEEPIRQLIQLFDKLTEILQRHPQADAQKGYENLIKRCRNFLRYIEQSLAMLGAEIINETNVPFDFSRHETANTSKPTERATVSKILREGFIYKGQVIRKAEIEFVEPSATISQPPKTSSRFGNLWGGKFS
ncbi:MAG: nucleotide exchange factor GrpE [Selenomonadaceae bacterium]|nr:nucleotide exchange factor GrpE [Selenomonadaceae bacterium]